MGIEEDTLLQNFGAAIRIPVQDLSEEPVVEYLENRAIEDGCNEERGVLCLPDQAVVQLILRQVYILIVGVYGDWRRRQLDH